MINFANVSFNQKENKNIEEREKENEIERSQNLVENSEIQLI